MTNWLCDINIGKGACKKNALAAGRGWGLTVVFI
jgi:hypothetical protein